MASNQKRPELSAWEYVTLFYAALRTLNHTIIASITAPFRGSKGAKKYGQHVALSFTRKVTNTASVKHLQAILPTARDTYLAHAKKHNFKPEWETLPSGAEAYWFGDKNAEKTLLFFHGGGYALPVTPAHLTFLTHLTTLIPTLRILLPAYTLAPTASYPTQLSQAAESLHLLLSPPFSLSPSQISIAGDSAGGNLTLALLSHLLHPHPDLPATAAIDLKGESWEARVLGARLKEKHEKVTLLVADGEWHENCVQEMPKDESKVTRDAITAFMAERV
ncbi:uncharacterized protein KY384_008111 [Bacidia gigantensis]|uniref:uncharacterized protein n=1 Tax=Bacidia gigantensis TaxID=2732470 RepID=UPI001D05A3E3|nr:uncharacterized protein KY384_008111 [Bacidia gigantensis]KAG8526682.1 hypothetical protein KY384_008111 [Bacidia gigantensis]